LKKDEVYDFTSLQSLMLFGVVYMLIKIKYLELKLRVKWLFFFKFVSNN